MFELGGCIVWISGGQGVIYLYGDFGVGKIIFLCGILCGFGYVGLVKSLIFILVEFYEIGELCVYYFDLYWFVDVEELEFFGICDYFDGSVFCLIEWFECGVGVLLIVDLDIIIIV